MRTNLARTSLRHNASLPARTSHSLLNRPRCRDPGRDIDHEPLWPGDHPVEVSIHSSAQSAWRSPSNLLREFLIVVAAVLVSIGVMSAPVWAAAPSNDELAGALAVAVGDHVTTDTTEATTNAGDPAPNGYCNPTSSKASVWYTFTAANDHVLALDPTSSTYSASLLVFEGAPSEESRIACGPGKLNGLAVHAGTTYTVMVLDDDRDGDMSNGGELVLDVIDAGPLPSMDVNIDSRATVDDSGTAWVTGTYACVNTHSMALELEVGRKLGRGVYGFAYTSDESRTDEPLASCDGTPQPFALAVTPQKGQFGGKARAVIFGYACGNLVCNDKYTEASIQLVKGY